MIGGTSVRSLFNRSYANTQREELEALGVLQQAATRMASTNVDVVSQLQQMRRDFKPTVANDSLIDVSRVLSRQDSKLAMMYDLQKQTAELDGGFQRRLLKLLDEQLTALRRESKRSGGGLVDLGIGALALGAGRKFMGGAKAVVGTLYESIMAPVKAVGSVLGKLKETTALTKIGAAFSGLRDLKPIAYVAEGLGAVFGASGVLAKAGTILAPFSKLAGAGSSVLGKLLLPITVIMGIFDAIDGWSKAGDLLGKAEKELTDGDRVVAALSSVLNGISFGLGDWVSKKFGFDNLAKAMSAGVKDASDKFDQLLQDPVKAYTEYMTWLGQKYVDVYSAIGNSVKDAGAYMLSKVPTLDEFKDMLDVTGQTLKQGFVDAYGIVGINVAAAAEWLKTQLPSLEEAKLWGSDAIDKLKAIANSPGEYFNNAVASAMAAVPTWDSIKSKVEVPTFDTMIDRIKAIFNDISTGVEDYVGEKMYALKRLVYTRDSLDKYNSQASSISSPDAVSRLVKEGTAKGVKADDTIKELENVARMADNEASRKTALAALSEYKNSRGTPSGKLNELQGEFQNVSARHSAAMTKIDEYDKAVAERDGTRAELGDVVARRKEIKDSISRNSSLFGGFSANYKDVESALATLRQSDPNATRDQAIKKVQGDWSANKAEDSALKLKQDALLSRFDEQDAAAKKLTSQMDAVNTEYEATGAALKSLTEKLAALQEKLTPPPEGSPSTVSDALRTQSLVGTQTVGVASGEEGGGADSPSSGGGGGGGTLTVPSSAVAPISYRVAEASALSPSNPGPIKLTANVGAPAQPPLTTVSSYISDPAEYLNRHIMGWREQLASVSPASMGWQGGVVSPSGVKPPAGTTFGVPSTAGPSSDDIEAQMKDISKSAKKLADAASTTLSDPGLTVNKPVSTGQAPPAAPTMSPGNAATGASSDAVAKAQKLMQKADPKTVDAIKRAAAETGMDPGYMLAMAAQESAMGTNTYTSTSSAKGVFQFTTGKDGNGGTWADPRLVQKRRELGLSDDVNDAYSNARMAAEYSKITEGGMRRAKGAELNDTDRYIAHFMGEGDGPRFMQALANNPNATWADLMPRAAGANANIAYDKSTGSARSVQQVYDLLNRKVGSQSVAYSEAAGLPVGQAVASASPAATGQMPATSQVATAVPRPVPSAAGSFAAQAANRPATTATGGATSAGVGTAVAAMVPARFSFKALSQNPEGRNGQLGSMFKTADAARAERQAQASLPAVPNIKLPAPAPPVVNVAAAEPTKQKAQGQAKGNGLSLANIPILDELEIAMMNTLSVMGGA
jgi:hypothetical protein